jgi:opacity protein-like surface antigen
MKSGYFFVLLVTSIMLAAAPCNAQIAGKNLKIFVGYSNLQAEGLQNTNTPPNLFNSDFFRDRTTLHGVDGSITGAYKGIGITGNVSFNRHSLESDFTGGHGNDDLDIWYFLAGPAFHYVGNRRVEPFVRIMAGAAYTRRMVSATIGSGTTSSTGSFQSNATSFAMGAGGGLDVRLGAGPVRLRVIQIDYTPIFFRNRDITILGDAGAVQPASLEGDRADNVRFAVGVVF